MMHVIVTQFVTAVIIAALAIAMIAGFSSAKPTLLQLVKIGSLDKLPDNGRGGLMSCAHPSQACPGPYEPVLASE
jgi:hypothetical protein